MPDLPGLVIDNFAGGGGASLGIEMALGRPVDIAINHDPEAVAMHAANHPGTRHFTQNIWQVDPRAATGGKPVALAWFSPDCFPAGTLVLTDTGYRPIEDIEVGDRVLSHRLQWRRVTETHRAHKPVLTARGHGHPGLTTTHEHPFWARRRRTFWNSEIHRYEHELEGADWIPVASLGRDWYWATPRRFPEAEPPEIGGRGFAIDARLMWLVGRYLADGWTRLTDTRAELVITCAKAEAQELRAHLSEWPRQGERSGADELAWHERATATAYQFATNHRGLVAWLRSHFGHRAESKTLPAWALGMAADLRAALAAGYLSGDGWTGAAVVECRTVSKALAFSLKALFGSLGNSVTVYLLANSALIEGRTVNARPIYLLRYRLDPRPSHRQTLSGEDGRCEWTPIRAVSDVGDHAEVFNIGVEDDESYVVEGVIVHNCKHFSKAKGGKPVEKRIRDLAWVVVHWARLVRPAVIMLENVEEFRDWGPLVEAEDGRLKPCPLRKGLTFRRWLRELRKLGYAVEHRELRASHYGAPTIRKRLFLIARRDGKPIVWPAPTHGPAGSGLLPWRTAASDVIDWSLPCPSIFLTREEGRALGVNRPLAEATMRRIARGVRRYVLEAAQPFIVPVTHAGDARCHGAEEPLRTVTTAHRGEHAVVSPFVTKFRSGATGQPVEEPLATVTANSFEKRPGGAVPLGVVAPVLCSHYEGDGGLVRSASPDEPLRTITTPPRHSLVAPYLVPRYGERPGQDPRTYPADAPAPTIVPTANQGSLAAVFLAQHNTDVVGHAATEPVSTIVGKGCTQGVVSAGLINMKGADRRQSAPDAPAPTVCAQGWHLGEVRAFLQKYYGTGGQDLDARAPLHTVPTKARFGLVTVAGELWQIADIGMRMLTPRELFRAQGFPDGYVIDPIVNGKPLTKTAQIRMCGNSVCPPVAHALVAANLAELAVPMAAAE